MKYLLSIAFILYLQCGKAQDTSKLLSSHSISITAGTNITYPRSTQFIDGDGMPVYPYSGSGYWFEINTGKAFKQTEYTSFGISYGIGYTEYKYRGIPGYDGAYTELPAPSTLQENDEVEANIGVFVNEKITRKIYWYNKMGFSLAATVYKLYVPAPGPNPDPGSLPPRGALLDVTTEETANIYMFYQTGIAIALSKHFTLTPTIEIPFINLTSRSLGWSNMLNTVFNDHSGAPDLISPYDNLETGLLLTYTFNKKVQR